MSAVQHTPGPWLLDEDDLSVSAEVGAHICSVADVQDFPCLDPDEHPEEAVADECLANARLIAAAPDMLAALRRIANPSDTFAATAVLAAIAKAEGRS